MKHYKRIKFNTRIAVKNFFSKAVFTVIACIFIFGLSACNGTTPMPEPIDEIKQPTAVMDVSISRWNGISFLFLPILHTGYYQWQRIQGFVGEGLDDIYIYFSNYALGMPWNIEGYEEFSVAMIWVDIMPKENFNTDVQTRKITGLVYTKLNGVTVTVPYYVNIHLMEDDKSPGSGLLIDGMRTGVPATHYFNSLRSIYCTNLTNQFTVNLPFLLELYHWFTSGIIVRELYFTHGSLDVIGEPKFGAMYRYAVLQVRPLQETFSLISDTLVIDFSFEETPEIVHSVYGSTVIFLQNTFQK